MLDPGIDLEKAAARYASTGRAQVCGLLQSTEANRLRDALEQVDWLFAFNYGQENRQLSRQEMARMGPDSMRSIMQGIVSNAQENFQYCFEFYPLLENYHSDTLPDPVLARLVDLVHSEAFLDVGRKVTGIGEIRTSDCQAMRYRGGHFLTEHTDDQINNRQAAWVLNLSRNWRPDWGGTLNFLGKNGDVEEGFMPRFNTFNILRVPQAHAVSYLSPMAGEPRYSITGWFMT